MSIAGAGMCALLKIKEVKHRVLLLLMLLLIITFLTLIIQLDSYYIFDAAASAAVALAKLPLWSYSCSHRSFGYLA